MKTICLDLTADELAALRGEPWGYVKRVMTPDDPCFLQPPLNAVNWVQETLLAQLPARMAERITVHACGCWVVAGHNTSKGHAKVWVAGKSRQFHRVTYQLLVGSIPEGLIVDHVKERGCQFRNCANPEHLEPVTVLENTRRGDGVKHWFGNGDTSRTTIIQMESKES